MLFRKESRKDAEEIKKVVDKVKSVDPREKYEGYENMSPRDRDEGYIMKKAMQNAPAQPQRQAVQQQSATARPEAVTQKRNPAPQHSGEPNYAPLFVKIDRYKEMLEHIKYLEKMSHNLKRMMAVLSQIEETKSMATAMIERSIEEIHTGISSMDAGLLRPKAMEQKLEVPNLEVYDDSLSDIHKRLEKIRKEMEKI